MISQALRAHLRRVTPAMVLLHTHATRLAPRLLGAMLLAVTFAVTLAACAPPPANLFRLVNQRNYQQTERALQSDATRVNTRDRLMGFAPLHFAARNGDARMVTLLLSKGADPKLKLRDGRTALHLAAEKHATGAVKALLAGGAPLEAQDQRHFTPLWSALAGGARHVAKILLARGARVVNPGAAVTSLRLAVEHGLLELAQLLIAKGVDVSARSRDGRQAIHLAAGKTGAAKLIALLLEKGVKVNATDAQGNTPLHVASRGVLRFLTVARAGGGAARTPVRLASAEVLALLLARGAHVNAKNRRGVTPLHLAAEFGLLSAAQTLLARGADPRAASATGLTPLHYAAMGSSVNVTRGAAQLLGHRGAFSFTTCNPRLAALLVRAGADRMAKDHKGRRAADVLDASCRRNGVGRAMAQAVPGQVVPGQAVTPSPSSATRRPATARAQLSATQLEALQDACREGHTQRCSSGAACFALGGRFRRGEGMPPSLSWTARCLARGCALAHAESCNQLGVLYSAGQGVTKNLERAAGLFRQACRLRFGWGCYNLGRAQQRGHGVKKNLAQARAHYRLACQQGCAAGCNGLGLLYEAGKGVAKSLPRAAKAFDQACKGKLADGCFNLGYLSQHGGAGVKKSAPRAAALYRQACQRGKALACNNLGFLLQAGGRGLKADLAGAISAFKKGCKGKVGSSCQLLATLYQKGQVFEKNLARARALFLQACRYGHKASCQAARGRR